MDVTKGNMKTGENKRNRWKKRSMGNGKGIISDTGEVPICKRDENKREKCAREGNTCNGIVEAPDNTHLLWHTI
jgi:hypothetical protein